MINIIIFYHEEDLEIVSDRISTSKRIKNYNSETPQSSRNSIEINEIEPHYYYITGILGQRNFIITINTGQEENYITKELMTEEEINSKDSELPKEFTIVRETVEKELIIGGIPMVINFKIYNGDKNIMLGIKWLEDMKPYNLESTQLTVTYKNKKVIIKRTI